MRTPTQTEFADDAHTVTWCACERCGAPGPSVICHRYNDHVSETLRLRTGIGCCGPSVLPQVGRGVPRDGEAVL